MTKLFVAVIPLILLLLTENHFCFAERKERKLEGNVGIPLDMGHTVSSSEIYEGRRYLAFSPEEFFNTYPHELVNDFLDQLNPDE